MAWGRGAGKGREDAEGVDVDYAPASVAANTTEAEAAKAFITDLTTSAATAVIKARGMEPFLR